MKRPESVMSAFDFLDSYTAAELLGPYRYALFRWWASSNASDTSGFALC